MSERNYTHFLEDINESISNIFEYTDSYTYKDFINDKKTVDAVIRNLEIIGEAANKIPAKIKKKYPDVPWNEMYRMRNKVVHEYFGIDHEIVWDIIINYLPDNLKQVKSILEIEQ
jgi:uncharacterized protein with HEPN domain